MATDRELLNLAQAAMNYTDEEVEVVKSNPKYLKIFQKTPEILNTEFIFEVDDAHGCACQHRKGQRIRVAADGSIICGQSPDRICVYLINAIGPIVYGAQEFIFAGLDPNELKFTTVGCFDNGVRCGGLGHVSLRFTSRKRYRE